MFGDLPPFAQLMDIDIMLALWIIFLIYLVVSY